MKNFLIDLCIRIIDEIDLKEATMEELDKLDNAASNIVVDIRREERRR